MAVSAIVGTAKKIMQFGIFVFVEAQEINLRGYCKVVNVIRIIYFYKNFFRFTKKFLPLYNL